MTDSSSRAIHSPLSKVTFALVALAVSAVLLIVVFVKLSPDLVQLYENVSRDNRNPWTITGSDLVTRMGITSVSPGDSLSVKQLQTGIDNRALMTRKVRLQARDFPFVQASITNQHPGLPTYFIWRTADKPEKIHYQRLHYGLIDTRTQSLAQNSDWQGTITEIGLDMYGELRPPPITIKQLKLLPPAAWPYLSSIFSDWTTFTGWNNSSVNKYRGVSSAQQLHPVTVVALWGALAAVLLVVFSRFCKPFNKITLLTVVLIPWLVLDAIWQAELLQQAQETNYIFGGRSDEEKKAADVDGDLFLYINRLKSEVMQDKDAKILLLHNSNKDDFNKLRAYFHLLPRNTYPFGQVPPKEKITGGEYIFTMGALDKLTYHKQSQSLRWKKWGKYPQCIAANELDSSKLGTVYRVSKTPGKCSAY